MNEFDKELIDVYIDMIEKYYELILSKTKIQK